MCEIKHEVTKKSHVLCMCIMFLFPCEVHVTFLQKCWEFLRSRWGWFKIPLERARIIRNPSGSDEIGQNCSRSEIRILSMTGYWSEFLHETAGLGQEWSDFLWEQGQWLFRIILGAGDYGFFPERVGLGWDFGGLVRMFSEVKKIDWNYFVSR